jgi:hypothetical protein
MSILNNIPSASALCQEAITEKEKTYVRFNSVRSERIFGRPEKNR